MSAPIDPSTQDSFIYLHHYLFVNCYIHTNATGDQQFQHQLKLRVPNKVARQCIIIKNAHFILSAKLYLVNEVKL